MEQDKQNTALLVMDMQTAILRNYPDAASVVRNTANAIAAARHNKIPVIYVTVGFRAGTPEISGNNKSFSASRQRFANMNTDEFLRIEPALAPLADDTIVVKRRVSAFTGSDLEVILRAQAIQHIVLTGVATSGVVLSTTREAADRDYRITILSDCCGDADPETHRVLTTKVFPKQAEVVTVEEWGKAEV
jgi:nicotinamidase-related amidase